MKTLTARPATRLAANIATLAFAAAAVTQLLLAAGVLPSTMAWGGTQPVLTLQLRLASLVAALLLGVFAYVIRRRAGLAGSRPASRPLKIAAWVITLYMALNTLGNFASPSLLERAVFGPLALILVIACLVVSLSRAAD